MAKDLDLSALTAPLPTEDRTIGSLKIERVTDNPSPYINILVYGPSGVGKTTLAGSASVVKELSPVLFVDVEGGTLSLTNSYPEVDRVRVDSWDDMQELYDNLRRGTSEYRTVVLDSLTEMQKFSMDQIMKDLIRNDPDRDPDVAGMREWGKNIEQIRRMVRAFRDLPINTIFTALSKQDKDPRTGMLLTTPSLSGKLAGEVAAFLDIVVYYYIKRVDNNDKRLLLASATDTTVAKDRTGRLPSVMEEAPTMAAIYNLITGKGND